MSGTKPVGQGIQVNHASIENISPKSLDTKAINRLDGFAQLDGMEGFPSVFRHSGLLMPGQTGLFASQDSIETKYGDVNVIPLEEMDTILSDPKLQEQEPKDLVTMTAAFNVAFYGNWEPEAMSLEFDQAHKTLKETQIQPGPILMALEAAYAPNEGRFVEWVTMRMDLWNDRGSYCSLEDKGDLNMTMAVTYGWYDQLSQDSKSKVNELFRKTHEIINAKEFSFSKDMTGGYGAFALMGRVLSEQLLYSRVSRFADKEEEEFQLSADLFSEEADPKETFKALDEHNVFYGEIPKKWLDSIWHLMNNQAEEIMEMEDYWMHMRTFLRDHPQYIDAFFQRHDYWEAKMIHGEGETTYTKSSDLKICYESLAGSGLVPEEYKLQVYRYILGYHGPKTFAAFLEIEDANLLEEKLISYCILDQVKEDPEIYNTALGFGRDLLGMRLKEWGADDLTAFLKRILPEDIQEQMSISWKIVRLMLDQDRDAVDFFLSQSQGIQDIVDQSIVEDPLWAFLWSELIPTGSGLMFLDWYSSGDKYKVALGEVPDLLINTGNQDVLEAFYQANHPYKTLYDLPADLRPTGRGLSFVSIDEFGNPKHIKHLDKKHVRNINGDSDYWADVDKDDSATHGVSTSSLAVGREYVLAPDAKLYLAPVDIEGETLAATLLRNLEDVVAKKQRDPSIALVGMSLGLEIPHVFRDQALESEIFKKLVAVCETLYEMDVALIASSGNAGSDELINMIGFLPHLQIIGSAHSRLTEDFSDDLQSYYTTGGDTVNPVRFHAQADPLLLAKREDELAWHWDSGTSFAQPNFSGVCLLMKDVNPELSWDEIYAIIEETSVAGSDINLRGVTIDDPITVIDPMAALSQAAQLPGSQYKGTRLDRFLASLE